MTVTGPPDDYTGQLKQAAHEVLSMSACPHEIWERESDVIADGSCPICLRAKVERLNAALNGRIEVATDLQMKCERLQAENTRLKSTLKSTLVTKRDMEDALRNALTALEPTWRDRYEAERQDHEATMKAWDEERSGL